jgi:taurine dioxygenase
VVCFGDRVEGMRMTAASTDTRLLVEPQTPAIGATITGIDLALPLDRSTYVTLREALLRHLVICIRDQGHLSPDQQIAFARSWGRIEPHPYVEPIEGYPEIMRVYDPTPLTAIWHADFTYAKTPPAISILLAREIPPLGGDTMFANGYLVYEQLSPDYRDMLDRLSALHEATEMGFSSGLPEEELRNVHPVIRMPSRAAGTPP